MTAPAKQSTITRLFYQSDRLCSCSGSLTDRLVMAQGIAIGQKSNSMSAKLYQLDCAQSVIGTSPSSSAYHYTAYGDGTAGIALLMSAFAGERFDPISHGYPLGNGLRVYQPRVFRFTTPDELSPFGKGGVNPYSYCQGDPVNKYDPSGQFAIFRYLLRIFARTTVAAQRHLGRATQSIVLAADEALAETIRHAGRQLTPAFNIGRDVITAATAVPTELSMRANTMILQAQVPASAHPSGPTPRTPGSPAEQVVDIRR